MQAWLAVFIGRLLRGERLEKANRDDYRLWFGVLCLTPLYMVIFAQFEKPLGDASTFILWFGVTGFSLVIVATLLVWARFVSAFVSLGLSVLSWGLMFAWFYHGK